MRIGKLIVTTMALVAILGRADDSPPFVLDNATSPLGESVVLPWNAEWIGGDANATVVIADNGVEVKRTTGAGMFTYTPPTIGRHELTYTTYVGGVVQDEVYSAIVFKDWKYKIRDGGAVIIGTSHVEGDIIIPAEIDGYPVTSIEDVFAGCSGLTSVTIPNSVTNVEANAFCCPNLTNIVFLGNAPSVGGAGLVGFNDAASDCVVKVSRSSTGWGVEIPGTWNGLRIEYLEEEDEPPEPVGETWNVTIADGACGIQAAVEAAADGDTILVGPGTYSSIQTGGKKLTIRSTGGADVTFIDGGSTNRCATLSDAADWDDGETLDGSTLVGFTLVNGYADGDDGGGLFGGVAVNCVIRDCQAHYISKKTGEEDAGGGGAICAKLYNCLIYGNKSKNGAGASDSVLYNCTVAGNTTLDGVDTSQIGYSYAYNTIVGAVGVLDTWNSTYENCLLPDSFQYSAPDGCVKGDIRFVDAANGDYRLVVGSAAIDAGNNSFVQLLNTEYGDLDGEERIFNGTVDIGCYEYWDDPLVPIAIGEALGADAASASLPWTVGTNGVAAAKGFADATVVGEKSVKFTAVDESSAWVETVVTNACRVSFDWKCSCEPLVKGRPYDYLAFSVDGARQDFICDETGWTNETFYVEGDGEHHLRWTFLRDEGGSSGEDSAWLANVAVAQAVTLAFAAGGATAGGVPEPVSAYADESVVLPGQGSLAWPKHAFLGWSDGAALYAAGAEYAAAGNTAFTAQWLAKTLSAPVITAPATYETDSATVTIAADAGASVYYTLDGSEPNPAQSGTMLYQGPFIVEGSATIKAVAVRDDYFDSEVASATVTRLPWTFGECLNWPEQTFATGGDVAWTRVKGVSADGYALRSGVVTHSQTSRLETVVSGAGTIRFACRVEGEIVKRVVWDGLAFCIDGVQQGDLMGNSAWATNTFDVAGGGAHTLSWLYVKDEENDGDGDDCAWLDEVVWTPAAEPIPTVAVDAAPEAVTNAIEAAGFADTAAIKAAIGGEGAAAKYAAFKKWAGSVKGTPGSAGAASTAGEAAVVANTNAAAAFLLGAERLFENAPVIEIVEAAIGGKGTQETGTQGQGTGTEGIALTVSVIVKDGEDAVQCAAEKVKEMFEATGDLGDWGGSGRDGAQPSQNALPITVTVEAGEGDTMRFRVTPGDGTATRAFLRIRK